MPYLSRHVPTYHVWMQDADLQAATASEPLTLPEEYEMQRSWRNDKDKLTFIVCLADKVVETEVQGGYSDRSEHMIGDINLFLYEPDDEDSEDDGTHLAAANGTKTPKAVVGEIELMIARRDLHRQGYGRAALLLFTSYILDSWTQISSEYSDTAGPLRPLEYLRVKINQTNDRSIALFESVGFKQTAAGPNYFGEVELRWQPDRSELERRKGWEEPRTLKYVEP